MQNFVIMEFYLAIYTHPCHNGGNIAFFVWEYCHDMFSRLRNKFIKFIVIPNSIMSKLTKYIETVQVGMSYITETQIIIFSSTCKKSRIVTL